VIANPATNKAFRSILNDHRAIDNLPGSAKRRNVVASVTIAAVKVEELARESARRFREQIFTDLPMLITLYGVTGTKSIEHS
jgi:hypothetical protein